MASKGENVNMAILRPLMILILLTVMTGCSSGHQFSNVRPADWQYVLDNGDEIKIVVFGEEEISDTYRIDSSGNVTLPFIGTVEARGLTTNQIANSIIQKLRQGYLNNPSVRVEVVAYRPFYVLGEVRAPGQYPYVENLTVLSAIATAGGFTYRAKTNTFRIVRRGKDGEPVEGEGQRDTVLYPGDIVYVKERIF